MQKVPGVETVEKLEQGGTSSLATSRHLDPAISNRQVQTSAHLTVNIVLKFATSLLN